MWGGGGGGSAHPQGLKLGHSLILLSRLPKLSVCMHVDMNACIQTHACNLISERLHVDTHSLLTRPMQGKALQL